MAGKKSGSKGGLTASSVYLLMYNGAQLAGWILLTVQMILHLLSHGTYSGLYASSHLTLKIFQTAAILEVIHALTGLVPSNVIVTGFQLYSRIFLVWGVLYSVPECQESLGVPLLYIAWGVTEIIRYAYYSLNILGLVPWVLQWCRYTFFYFLYPTGVTGELLCMIAALPFIKSRNLYSLDMPNPINWSFSYYYYLIIIMLGYIPIFPWLYFHMIHQRKKVLGSESKKKP